MCSSSLTSNQIRSSGLNKQSSLKWTMQCFNKISSHILALQQSTGSLTSNRLLTYLHLTNLLLTNLLLTNLLLTNLLLTDMRQARPRFGPQSNDPQPQNTAGAWHSNRLDYFDQQYSNGTAGTLTSNIVIARSATPRARGAPATTGPARPGPARPAQWTN